MQVRYKYNGKQKQLSTVDFCYFVTIYNRAASLQQVADILKKDKAEVVKIAQKIKAAGLPLKSFRASPKILTPDVVESLNAI